MKVLKYRLMTEVNHGTEEQPDIWDGAKQTRKLPSVKHTTVSTPLRTMDGLNLNPLNRNSFVQMWIFCLLWEVRCNDSF